MNAKHTPGPWEAVDSMTVRTPLSAGGFMVADLPCHTPHGERIANAKLIAAAPELLAAANAFVELYEAFEIVVGTENGSTNRVHCALDAARAAIAKAKGDLSGMWDAIPDDERAELTRAFAAGFAEQSKGGEQ